MRAIVDCLDYDNSSDVGIPDRSISESTVIHHASGVPNHWEYRPQSYDLQAHMKGRLLRGILSLWSEKMNSCSIDPQSYYRDECGGASLRSTPLFICRTVRRDVDHTAVW